MTLVVFGSLKGAPGVTTLATLIAYQWPRHRQVILVEADTDGGTVAPRFGLHPDAPSLVSFAAQSRHGVSKAEFWAACQRLPDGPAVLVAPGGKPTLAALEQVDLADVHRVLGDTDVLVDAGRLRATEAAARLRDVADFVVAVILPNFESLAVLLDRVAVLSERTPLLAVVAGEGPYPVAEIDAALRQASGDRAWVLGAVAGDPRGAAALASDSGRERALRRSQLGRTVRPVTDVLAYLGSAGLPASSRAQVQ